MKYLTTPVTWIHQQRVKRTLYILIYSEFIVRGALWDRSVFTNPSDVAFSFENSVKVPKWNSTQCEDMLTFRRCKHTLGVWCLSYSVPYDCWMNDSRITINVLSRWFGEGNIWRDCKARPLTMGIRRMFRSMWTLHANNYTYILFEFVFSCSMD